MRIHTPISRPTMGALLGLLALGTCLPACKRSRETPARQDAGPANVAQEALVCVEQPDGCLFCAGKDEQAPFLEPDQSRPLVCDPKDEENCVEFCSLATPPCALPWFKGGPRCLVRTDVEFRRVLFNWSAADRPEVVLAGRVVDESGKRLEGARVRVWLSRPPWPGLVPLVDEMSGKDGVFRISLRSGPWAYALRISHPGHVTDIVDRIPADKLDRSPGATPRLHRLAAEQAIRGKVVDLTTGAPVARASLQAVRTLENPMEISEAETGEDGSFVLGGLERGRYFLRVSKFGWRPLSLKAPVAAPAQKVTLKLIRANVIRGLVVDGEGEAEPNTTVAAVFSGPPGVPSPPIVWATDDEGTFRQDHFVAGTYYLWARRGDMLAYPPIRIELGDSQTQEVKIALSHKGARVAGSVLRQDGHSWEGEVSVGLVSRSPLAFPVPRGAVARVDRDGRFAISGVLPGRYEISIRSGFGAMTIMKGPREVEVPIEPGSTVTLSAPVLARPLSEE